MKKLNAISVTQLRHEGEVYFKATDLIEWLLSTGGDEVSVKEIVKRMNKACRWEKNEPL